VGERSPSPKGRKKGTLPGDRVFARSLLEGKGGEGTTSTYYEGRAEGTGIPTSRGVSDPLLVAGLFSSIPSNGRGGTSSPPREEDEEREFLHLERGRSNCGRLSLLCCSRAGRRGKKKKKKGKTCRRDSEREKRKGKGEERRIKKRTARIFYSSRQKGGKKRGKKKSTPVSGGRIEGNRPALRQPSSYSYR